MKVYFYHTQDVQRIVREWGEGRFPGHFLYGAFNLRRHGIEVIFHRHTPFSSRLKVMFHTAWHILSCRERFDAVYATHYQGLEIIIFLRAIGLFRRPIVLWYHQPMPTRRTLARRLARRFFIAGIDRIIFFSEKIKADSMASPYAIPERMSVGHWGAELEFYDRLMRADGTSGRHGVISTGKEMRDVPTLIEGAMASGVETTICLPSNFGYPDRGVTRESLARDYGQQPVGNVRVCYVHGLIPFELARRVNGAACVAVCTYATNYTAGLTTLVEALALGLPVVCSRNEQMPFDVEAEGCGIAVDYGDADGWARALRRLADHPDEAQALGRRGRQLAERRFNDHACAADAARLLYEVAGHGLADNNQGMQRE